MAGAQDMPGKTVQASAAEIEERLAYIENLITRGFSQREIVRHVREKCSWDVEARQIRNYCYKAMERLQNAATGLNRAAYFQVALERVNTIYQRAMERGELSAAGAANQQLIKLLRLDSPQAAIDWKSAALAVGVDPADIMQRILQDYETLQLVEGETVETEY